MIILLPIFILNGLFFGGQMPVMEDPLLQEVAYAAELGIVELSPKGESGGYAMPASGCSVVHTPAPPVCTGYICVPGGYIHGCAATVDLQVAHVLPYSGIEKDDRVRISLDVTNTGTTDASSTQATVMIDYNNDGIGALTDAAGRSYDRPLYIGVQPGVFAGDTTRFITSSLDPWIARVGDHAIAIRVDHANQVPESNEGNNVTGWRPFTVIDPTLPPPPSTGVTANLTGHIVPGGTPQGGTLSIDPGDNVTLSWSSTGAVSCAGSGASFSTGSNTSGDDTTITEPVSGNNTYTVTCTASDGSTDSDSLVVAVQLPGPTIDVDKTIVRKGEPIEATWDTKGHPNCVLLSPLTEDPHTINTETVSLNNSATLSIECDGGSSSASVDVKVLPVLFET